MTLRATSILASACAHLVLVAVLALLASPGRAPVEDAGTVVRLRIEPRPAAAAEAASPQEPARAPSASQPRPAGRPAAATVAEEASGPAAAVPAGVARPRIAELAAVTSRTAYAEAGPPLPAGRLAASAGPLTAAGVRSEAPAARPIGQLSRGDAGSSGGAPPAVTAPELLPDPRELLREMERPASAAPAAEAPGAAVEPELVVAGRTLRTQPPLPFPAALLAQGREAEVTVRIRIRPDGSVQTAGVTQSSGDPSVDNAVERVVRGYLFDAVGGGTIVEGSVTFHFRLERGF